jgi:catechol 2,3-dioxygenase-like lactoylglutathione lyase family enzyme
VETRRRARDESIRGGAPGLEPVQLEAAVPILRIFSVAKAGEFYVDYLGFAVDWEHRATRDAPLYLQVSRSGLRLHLSEHHRDGSPGAAVHVALRGVRELHAELDAKAYPYLNPRITRTPFGFALDLIDPFGNQLRFAEAAPQATAP